MESQRGIPLRKKKYLLKDSDRSGETYRNVELFLDNGHWVGPDEYDTPPPSDRLKPGEGEVSPGDTRIAYDNYSVDSKNMAVVQVLQQSSQIALSRNVDNAGQYTYIQSIVYVEGSLGTVALVNDNQIVASDHGDRLTVVGVGSPLVLQDGSGLSLRSSVLRLDSGTLINLIYNATDSLWYETSRGEVF